ncbi:riboflavin synthase [Flavobacteriaceae bacterium]|nr:riboflavin synthase [Flavobacteriaceae bacterium]MDA7797505.1 riboflavin synthase [Flavobacteriaceae bacterium]MDA9016260.1 riboflavin synthase [Flavobacteriaceae bacterium]MDB3862993.1 riboflavin synthase [Flavobacteriaceae bacterium]
MFTGIIEAFGRVIALENEGENLHISIESKLAAELKVDQSVAHNGVCLTVVKCDTENYTVTAIDETLQKTNLGALKVGGLVNLERAMKLGDRLDGHIVQGHVDQTARCIEAKTQDGSWFYTFEYDKSPDHITIEKGSITINGVSLTVVNSKEHQFSVAIIPYTYEHTNFNQLMVGSQVNLEFDLIGKYLSKLYLRR